MHSLCPFLSPARDYNTVVIMLQLHQLQMLAVHFPFANCYEQNIMQTALVNSHYTIPESKALYSSLMECQKNISNHLPRSLLPNAHCISSFYKEQLVTSVRERAGAWESPLYDTPCHDYASQTPNNLLK